MKRRKSTSTRRDGKKAGAAAPSDRFARIRRDHAAELAEDYLEMIADLIDETGEARAVDIAERLGVSHVTVTKAVARLQRDGLVTSAPYRSIFLTDEGKRVANRARRRHRLILDFLLALGVPQEDAEIDAEGIEHHLSAATLTAIRKYMRKK